MIFGKRGSREWENWNCKNCLQNKIFIFPFVNNSQNALSLSIIHTNAVFVLCRYLLNREEKKLILQVKKRNKKMYKNAQTDENNKKWISLSFIYGIHWIQFTLFILIEVSFFYIIFFVCKFSIFSFTQLEKIIDIMINFINKNLHLKC